MLLYIMDVNYILEVVSWTWKKVATKKAKRHSSLKILKMCNFIIIIIIIMKSEFSGGKNTTKI